MQAHHDALRQRFLERLLQLRPASVLDLGCGSGTLLDGLARAGVRAVGAEPALEAAARARAAGHRVVGAGRGPLPFADASFDWVTLRHVPHHLPQPRASLAEAWRVARSGLVLSEPYFDESLPHQSAGLLADRLLKRLDRARGMFHAERLGAGELLDLLPDGCAPARIESYVDLEPWPVDDLRERRAQARGHGQELAEDSESWSRLLSAAERGEVGRNGTLILVVPKRIDMQG